MQKNKMGYLWLLGLLGLLGLVTGNLGFYGFFGFFGFLSAGQGHRKQQAFQKTKIAETV